MEHLPVYLPILFGLVVLGAVTWFYLAVKSKMALYILAGWIAIQSILGITGVYQHTQSLPPRLLLFGFIPAIVFIVLIFATRWGRKFMEQIDLKTLTWFHSIRTGIELLLFWLFLEGALSVYMTAEGTNFDIITGITAPLAAYFIFSKGGFHKKLLLGWNLMGLLLLLNVVITAVFSIPSPIQKLAFDQPNLAVLYFPFNLLPAVLVPLVLFSHLAALWRIGRVKSVSTPLQPVGKGWN